MKLKSTPGPWDYCRAKDCPCGLIWDSTGNFVIATATSTCKEHEGSNLGEGLPRNSPMVRANAVLIASAPKMLDKLIYYYRRHPDEETKQIIQGATGMSIKEILEHD